MEITNYGRGRMIAFEYRDETTGEPIQAVDAAMFSGILIERSGHTYHLTFDEDGDLIMRVNGRNVEASHIEPSTTREIRISVKLYDRED